MLLFLQYFLQLFRFLAVLYQTLFFVVACEDFCINGYELREFRTIRNIYNKTLENKLIDENTKF